MFPGKKTTRTVEFEIPVEFLFMEPGQRELKYLKSVNHEDVDNLQTKKLVWETRHIRN